ncbi:hypothetical protein [Streptomyces mirabilis]|uniref:hypothetical protein n=1 Tax=Streptomyces mirabilis TaxID=68239 RepID=UPI0033241041
MTRAQRSPTGDPPRRGAGEGVREGGEGAVAGALVLTDVFREFVPALREGLIGMLDLVGMREHDPNTGDDAHAALVRAVADTDTAGTVLREELEETLALLRRPVTRMPNVPE